MKAGCREVLTGDRDRLVGLFRSRGYHRVMIVTTRFGPYPDGVTILRGGIDSNMKNLIEILEGAGFRVSVAALDYMKPGPAATGTPVDRIGTYRPYAFERRAWRKFSKLLYAETINPVVLARLLLLIRRREPDVMILQESLQLGLAPHIASRLARVPLYFRNDWICPARPEDHACRTAMRLKGCSGCLETKMGQKLGRLQGYGMGAFSALVYLLKSRFWRTGAGAIPSSEYVADLLVDYGLDRDRITVVRPSREIKVHPVSDVPFVELERDGGRNLLFVGRLEKDKGIDVLVEAFEIARSRGLDARLLVAGEGTMRPLVEESAARCSRIIYLGWLDEAGLSQAYQVCDAVVMPTIVIESHGIVAEEAISYGKVLAGSDRGGLAAIMREYPRSVPIEEVTVESLSSLLQRLAEGSGS